MSSYHVIAQLRAAGLEAVEKRRNADPFNQIHGVLKAIAWQPDDPLSILDRYAAGELSDPGERKAAKAAAEEIRAAGAARSD